MKKQQERYHAVMHDIVDGSAYEKMELYFVITTSLNATQQSAMSKISVDF